MLLSWYSLVWLLVPIAIEGVNRLRGSNLTGTTSLLQGYINYQIRDIMGGGKIWDFKKGEGKSGEKKRRKWKKEGVRGKSAKTSKYDQIT